MHRKFTVFATMVLATLVHLASAAEAKPSIAILGLEVIAGDDEMDEESTKVAQELTNALRKRASRSGPYDIAPGGDRDLLEMKLLSACADEGVGCMADIGAELNADRLLYGKIEKRADGYQVSLKMLNVSNEAMERTTDLIPFSDVGDLDEWGADLYDALTGVPKLGTLIVKANVDSGTVYIDGDYKGNLSAGMVTIDGLAEGEHDIVVESDGHDKYAGKVSVSSGGTEEKLVTLSVKGSGGGGGGGGRPGGTARMLFWTSVVATTASATAMTITGLQVRGFEDDKEQAIRDFQREGNTPDNLAEGNACGDAENFPNSTAAQEVIDACESGKSRATLTNVFIGTTVISALAAGYFYVKGYMQADKSSSSETSDTSKPKKSNVVVAPTVGPDHVGAGVIIEF